MKVEQRKISSLIPYAKNAKKHSDKQIQNVAKSIREYGFVQPVVIDRGGDYCNRALSSISSKNAQYGRGALRVRG